MIWSRALSKVRSNGKRICWYLSVFQWYRLAVASGRWNHFRWAFGDLLGLAIPRRRPIWTIFSENNWLVRKSYVFKFVFSGLTFAQQNKPFYRTWLRIEWSFVTTFCSISNQRDIGCRIYLAHECSMNFYFRNYSQNTIFSHKSNSFVLTFCSATNNRNCHSKSSSTQAKYLTTRQTSNTLSDIFMVRLQLFCERTIYLYLYLHTTVVKSHTIARHLLKRIEKSSIILNCYRRSTLFVRNVIEIMSAVLKLMNNFLHNRIAFG